MVSNQSIQTVAPNHSVDSESAKSEASNMLDYNKMIKKDKQRLAYHEEQYKWYLQRS